MNSLLCLIHSDVELICCFFFFFQVLVIVFPSTKISVWFFVSFIYLLKLISLLRTSTFPPFVSSMLVIACCIFMMVALKSLSGNSNIFDIWVLASIDRLDSV